MDHIAYRQRFLPPSIQGHPGRKGESSNKANQFKTNECWQRGGQSPTWIESLPSNWIHQSELNNRGWPQIPSNSQAATKNNTPREVVRRKNTSPRTARGTFVAWPLVRKAKELAGGSRISSRQCQGARHPSALSAALSLHSTNCT